MPDDKLRIGGWVPPEAQETRHLPVLASRPGPPALRDGSTELVPIGPDRKPRRVIIFCAVAVIAGTAGMLALIRPSGEQDVQLPIAGPMVFGTPSGQPSSEPPEPTYTQVVPPPANTGAAKPTTPPATARNSAPASPTRKSGQPSTPSLTAGSTIGLGVAGRRDDLRVHHDNFTVRVDELSSRSSASERAASRYTVRKGLGSADCLSFEAVDHPGYYLRHRVFDMVLDRRDNSTIFDQESTFCPVPTGNGKQFTLVTSYPNRNYILITGRDGRLSVTYAGMNQPTTFVARAPL